MAFWNKLFGGRNPDAGPPERARLRSQIFRDDYVGIRLLGQESATRRLAPGLTEAIVEDVAGGERTLRWEQLAHLGTSQDELFALARGQAADRETGVQSTTIEDYVQVFASNGFYMSSYLLRSFAGLPAGRSVLFIPLSWHHWCVHIVQTLTVPEVVLLMREVARDVARMMTASDAERLTDDVYWHRDGGSIEKVEVAGDEVRSPALRAALGR